MIDKDFLKSQIDFMRDSIGRTVTIYTTSLVACSVCSVSGFLDTASDTSWFVTCPECRGKYWKQTPVPTEVEARVHWVSNEGIAVTPGGKYYLGDAQITVDPSNWHLLEQAQTREGKVVVDGQEMEITRINPMGAPEVNRVRAILRSTGKRPDLG